MQSSDDGSGLIPSSGFKVLFNNGADIESKADVGITPLILAAKGGHADVVKVRKLILNRSPHPDMYRSQVLIDNGADIGEKDDFNYTALHYASYNGDVKAVEVF